MPTVPVYQRQVSIPERVGYAEGSLLTAAMPGQAMAEFGRAMSREADLHLEARRVNELSRRTLEASKEFDELDASVDQQGEWEEILPAYDAKLNELRTKYKTEITDPAVRNMFNRDFEKMAIRGRSRAVDVARKKESDRNHANLYVTLNEYSDLIAQAPTFERAAEKIGFARAAIAGAVASGTIDETSGVKLEREFTEKAQVNFIRREMQSDPEAVYKGLVAGAYPELDETRKTVLLKESRDLGEAEERKRIRILEQAEQQKEKAKKEAQEAAFGDLVVLKSKNQLDEVTIQRMILSRRIDPDKGNTLINDLRREAKGGEKIENNPMIVGDLSYLMELGADIREDLERARQKGQIKDETYIALKTKVGDRDFKRGLYHVNYALKPSEADQWTPDKHIRHAEAVEEFTSRVASGEPPMVVAKSVVENFTSDVRRTIRGIAAPRFLAGEKTNLQSLKEAQVKTAEEFRKNRISMDDFNREALRIQTLIDLVTRLDQGIQGMPAELSDRPKEALKKR